MKFHVLTLFPELIQGALGSSITGRALEKGSLSLNAVNIRDYANNKHQKVDDYPYGGGAGMVMQAEPVYRAYEDLPVQKEKRPRVIYLTPQGKVFNQEMAKEFSREEELVFLCGHYEGIDERVLEEIVTDYVSIGDYVLTGGELAALVMMDAVSRLVPGVLNNETSAEFESFHGSLLEYPQYSRPEVWHGRQVPGELMSGNHKKISAWRLEQSKTRTKERRPDLYAEYERRLACEQQLLKQKLLHMDMLESLRADRGRLQYFEKDGVMLLDVCQGVCQITAEDEKAAACMLEEAKKAEGKGAGLQMLVLHQETFTKCAKEKFSLSVNRTYSQYIYTLKNPLPLCYGAKVSVLDASYASEVQQMMQKAKEERTSTSSLLFLEKNVLNCLREGRMYGAFIEDSLCGILGQNAAGALEYFYVLPKYRRKGVGRALETTAINQQVSLGQVPFLWIEEGEAACGELQKKLGLYRAKGQITVLES